MSLQPKVFISYSRSDKSFVEGLVDGFKNSGLDVWIDQNMSAAEQNFPERITKSIQEADVVIVVWSSTSIKSQWVQAEAERAHSTAKLLQVRLDDCTLLVPYNIIQRQDLFNWSGDVTSPDFRQLVGAINDLAGVRQRKQVALRNDQETTALKSYLKEKLDIELVECVAAGDISTVYLGNDGWRQYAVKVIPDTRHDEDDIDREALIASQLYNPSFMRLIDVSFRQHDCIVISDYAPAQNLQKALEERRQSKGNMACGKRPFPTRVVIDLIRQLAEALTEAHYRGLRYTRISPREIYLLDDFVLEDAKDDNVKEEQTRRIRPLLAPINFAFRSELASSDRRIEFTADRGPFTAPEILKHGSPLSNNNWREILQKADQFSLGMVAWTMLEEHAPFLANEGHESAYARTERFLNAAPQFSKRVLEAEWRLEARALARIIARMLEVEPLQRWGSMKEVSRLFAALDADEDGEYLRNIVKQLYVEHCRIPAAAANTIFYERFYSRLFEKQPSARELFSSRGISDLGDQIAKLDAAFHQVLNYNQAQREPTPLTNLLARHSDLGLTKDQYKSFGEAIVETFDSFISNDDPRREMKAAALDVVIWPAIYYFADRAPN